MMNYLFIRHAESVGNATGDYSSEQADSLSSVGLAQAEALVDELGDWRFDMILVSPLLRAQQTIIPYLRSRNRVAEVWPELAEACWHDEREAMAGDWSRTSPAELPPGTEHLFVFRDNRPVQPGHPETFGQGLRRVKMVADRLEIMASGNDKTVLVVSHGHMMREVLNMILRLPELDEFHHDNRHATLIEFAPNPRLIFTNRHPREGRE